MPFAESLISPRVDAAAGRMRRLLNDGMLALLAGVGARAGLLRALVTRSAPATAAQLATATHLDRPLVESWLAAMVVGRVVDYDGARGTYVLPPETAAFLAGPEGQAFGVRLGELWTLATAEPLRHLSAVDAAAAGGPAVRDVVALVPGLAERLHRGPVRVLELTCGDGAFLCALAAAHPSTRCAGRDARRDPIGVARRRAQKQGLTNARFTCGTALPPPSTPGAYDLVVCLDEKTLASVDASPRLLHAMAPGAVAVLAVPATTHSPADDAFHPFGAYLHGARALTNTPLAPPSTEISARLAAVGLGVNALCRLPGDAFRDFLIVEKRPQQSKP